MVATVIHGTYNSHCYTGQTMLARAEGRQGKWWRGGRSGEGVPVSRSTSLTG